MEGMDDEEDLLSVQLKHGSFYSHPHLLENTCATASLNQSIGVQTEPIPQAKDKAESGSTSQEDGESHPPKFLAILQETPAFSALSDLVNHLSARNLEKYHFLYRRNRDGAVEHLEITLENAVIAASTFSDIPTRLLFSKKGKLTVLTLFRDPFQTDYVDSVSGQVDDGVVENAFQLLDNEQLFCPGVPKDVATKPDIVKKVQKYRFPFERYQSRGCPVWFDPPEDEIFAQDILIRKGIHPCEKCFKFYEPALNDADSDEAPPPKKTPAKTETVKKKKETTTPKRKCVKKKAEPSPTMVPRAESFPVKEATTVENIVESDDDDNLDIEPVSDSDGSDYCPSPEPTRAKRRRPAKAMTAPKSNAKATSVDAVEPEEKKESSDSDSGNDGGDGGRDNSGDSSGNSLSDEETTSKTKQPRKRGSVKIRRQELFRCEDCDKNIDSEKPWKTHRLKEHADERPYKCDLNCDFNCAEKTELIEHYTSGHGGETLRECRYCYRRFLKVAELNAHTRHHKGEKPVKCDQCPKILSNQRLLNKHVNRTHSGIEPEKKFVCEFCGKGYSKIDCFTIHKRTHTGERPFQCDVCGKDFHSKVVLKKHALSHSDSRLFLCTICGKSYKTNYSLTCHQLIHTGLKPYKCDVCGKCYALKNYLVVHALTHEMPHECQVCHKRFSLVYDLATHSCSTDELPFTCDICQKGFRLKQNFKKHLVTHSNEKPFSCEECGKSFHQASILMKHSRIHQDIRPYKCDECGMSFHNSSNLHKHIRIHRGIRPFKCDQCEKCFPDVEKLRRHTVVHTGEKPFVCDICDKKFGYKTNLHAHKKMHLGQNITRNNSANVETASVASNPDYCESIVKTEVDQREFVDQRNENLSFWFSY